jgi:hypothetical protein
MSPFECYKTYVAVKNHFTKESFDYHKYCGKTRMTVQSFYKRKDRYWFEKLSRQRNDSEIKDFFVSNFVACDDPQTLWIGELIKNGNTNYQSWQKRVQSLTYIFREEIQGSFSRSNFDSMFKIEENRHPPIVKLYLSKKISIETFLILDKILGFSSQFNKKLSDPIWELISFKLKKYNPFLNIDTFKFKKILKEIVL